MKKLLIICLLLPALNTVQAWQQEHPDTLLKQHRYFELRTALQSGSWQKLPDYKKLLYQAYLNNFFNELTASNKDINTLLRRYKKQLTAEETARLLMKKADNHIKQYQYKDAYETNRLILEKYGRQLSAGERKDLENAVTLWKGLQDTPPQTISRNSDTHLKYTRDLAKLINIPVGFTDTSFNFVFDTGANLCVISDSYATKAGLRRLNTSFRVRAITGIEVDALLGVADKMTIGELEINHAVFIIFPDSTLSFAGGAYTINGIIGFPVIEQLKEIHIDKNESMFIPEKPSLERDFNMGMDELTPMVNVFINGESTGLRFDTGSQMTFLNKSYYNKHKDLIDSTGEASAIQYGGAGGSTEDKSFLLPEVTFAILGKSVNMAKIQVKTTGRNASDAYHYGTLGQDFIHHFNEMIINFNGMSLKFK